MSTLRVTNLQDTAGNNSLTTQQIYNGAAKAWVNFNGTGTVAIRGSFNVSSITDLGAGYYRANFTNAMSNSDYAVTLGEGTVGSSDGSQHVRANPTTSSIDFEVGKNVGSAPGDRTYVFAVIFST